MADPFTWVAVIGTVVSTAAQVAGAQQQAKAAKVAGEQSRVNAQYQAAQQEQAAGQEQAAAQRRALDETRRARLIASRALALTGASGAGASDPTIVNLLADLKGEGAYRSSVALYGGEERARLLRQGALTSEMEGQVAQQEAGMRSSAYRMSAVGSLASGTSSLYAKYNTPRGGAYPQQAPAPVEDRYF